MPQDPEKRCAPHADSAPNPLVSTFADDPEMVELVDYFVSEMPGRVAALCSHWSRGELADVQRLAHQLKGASAGYGFEPVGSAAARLEDSLRALGASGPESELGGIKAEFDGLIALCRRIAAA